MEGTLLIFYSAICIHIFYIILNVKLNFVLKNKSKRHRLFSGDSIVLPSVEATLHVLIFIK